MIRPSGIPMRFALLVAAVFATAPGWAAEIIYPVADGTLADGGGYGSYDGIADSCNWALGPAGFSGAVTLTTETPSSTVEHRMVFEYDLRNVSIAPPFNATLTFTTRGVDTFPFPDMTLHVYSYPADAIESPSDFSAGPATLRGMFVVSAGQTSRIETLEVTNIVATALADGTRRVAYRFQIDPGTPHVTNQLFIDALDAEPATKPHLVIRSAVPGDADDDGDADLDDFAIFTDCLAGPQAMSTPTKPAVGSTDCLWYFDRNGDHDVDLEDFSGLLSSFTVE